MQQLSQKTISYNHERVLSRNSAGSIMAKTKVLDNSG